MKRKWIAALLAGCMLAALLLTGCSAAETVKRLRFGVAGEGGVYHNFGEQFAALENETSNGTIELRTTAGSAANLRLLTGEYLQLAIAQADLAQDACNQTGIFAEEEDIRGFGAPLIVIDGVPCLGYTMWGCIDLVSASTGEMAKRYGFIYVNKFDDGTGDLSREKKDSFYWYKKVIASNGEDLS